MNPLTMTKYLSSAKYLLQILALFVLWGLCLGTLAQEWTSRGAVKWLLWAVVGGLTISTTYLLLEAIYSYRKGPYDLSHEVADTTESNRNHDNPLL